MKSSINKDKEKKLSLDDDDKAVLDLEQADEVDDNDKILEEYENSGLVDQGEQAITYSVENLYKNKKMTKYRSNMSMQINPPKLKVETSNGDGFSIHLTEKLNHHLNTLLTDVDNAYMNKPKTKQHVVSDGWRLGDGPFDKMKKFFITRYYSFLLALVFILAGLLFGINFIFGGIVLTIIGLVMIAYPKDKHGDDNNE